MTDRVGQRLGNYRLLRLLGQGGFSEVYLGEHVFLGTQAAIKVLHVRLGPEELEAFQNEARTIAGLIHPNILRVLEFGLEDTVPFLVTEYASNGSLRQRHPRGSRLPPHVVLPYVKQAASALQYVHNQKMIHRDIKPENLVLRPGGEVLLSDFGTALVIQTLHNPATMEMAGTLIYMAPEQLRGKALPASDQYSLGIMVYEWLCGRPPFVGTFVQLSGQHLFAAPPSMRAWVPTIPADVEMVVMTALAKEPERRFATVTAFATALEQASITQQQPVAPLGLVFTLPVTPAPPPSLNPPMLEEQSPTLPASAITPTKTPLITPGTHEQIPTARFTPPVPESAFTPAPMHESFPGQSAAPAMEGGSSKSRRHSRRAVLVGLIGLGSVLAAGGAGAWFVLERRGFASANPPALTPTPVIAPGTTFVTYNGHMNQVYALAWHPRTQHLVSSGKDDKARVWDAVAPDGKDIYSSKRYGHLWIPHLLLDLDGYG